MSTTDTDTAYAERISTLMKHGVSTGWRIEYAGEYGLILRRPNWYRSLPKSFWEAVPFVLLCIIGIIFWPIGLLYILFSVLAQPQIRHFSREAILGQASVLELN